MFLAPPIVQKENYILCLFMGTEYVISGMPAAIFVTDSHSLFTLVMAANTAHLNGKERERYLVKTAIIGCDPYLSPTVFCLLNSAKCLPQLTFPDIYIYLVHNPSPFTGESLKAFKSTDAYQYAVAGWVNDTKIWHVEKTHLHVITAKVSHLPTIIKRVIIVVFMSKVMMLAC